MIVLSCHDEFDYVKKAMKEGADEYVLKNTLNEESLYTLLETAKEQLEKAEEESGNNQTPEQGVGSTELKGKEKEADAIKSFCSSIRYWWEHCRRKNGKKKGSVRESVENIRTVR